MHTQVSLVGRPLRGRSTKLVPDNPLPLRICKVCTDATTAVRLPLGPYASQGEHVPQGLRRPRAPTPPTRWRRRSADAFSNGRSRVSIPQHNGVILELKKNKIPPIPISDGREARAHTSTRATTQEQVPAQDWRKGVGGCKIPRRARQTDSVRGTRREGA